MEKKDVNSIVIIEWINYFYSFKVKSINNQIENKTSNNELNQLIEPIILTKKKQIIKSDIIENNVDKNLTNNKNEEINEQIKLRANKIPNNNFINKGLKNENENYNNEIRQNENNDEIKKNKYNIDDNKLNVFLNKNDSTNNLDNKNIQNKKEQKIISHNLFEGSLNPETEKELEENIYPKNQKYNYIKKIIRMPIENNSIDVNKIIYNNQNINNDNIIQNNIDELNQNDNNDTIPKTISYKLKSPIYKSNYTLDNNSQNINNNNNYEQYNNKNFHQIDNYKNENDYNNEDYINNNYIENEKNNNNRNYNTINDNNKNYNINSEFYPQKNINKNYYTLNLHQKSKSKPQIEKIPNDNNSNKKNKNVFVEMTLLKDITYSSLYKWKVLYNKRDPNQYNYENESDNYKSEYFSRKNEPIDIQKPYFKTKNIKGLPKVKYLDENNILKKLYAQDDSLKYENDKLIKKHKNIYFMKKKKKRKTKQSLNLDSSNNSIN